MSDNDQAQRDQLEAIAREAGFAYGDFIDMVNGSTDGAWFSVRFEDIDAKDAAIREAIKLGASVEQSDKGLIITLKA